MSSPYKPLVIQMVYKMARYDPDDLPEYNEAIMCPDCEEGSDIIIGLYGMFGGGNGLYTMCADCGKIVSKSFDDGELRKVIDSTATEVNKEVEHGRENFANDKGSQGDKS